MNLIYIWFNINCTPNPIGGRLWSTNIIVGRCDGRREITVIISAFKKIKIISQKYAALSGYTTAVKSVIASKLQTILKLRQKADQRRAFFDVYERKSLFDAFIIWGWGGGCRHTVSRPMWHIIGFIISVFASHTHTSLHKYVIFILKKNSLQQRIG